MIAARCVRQTCVLALAFVAACGGAPETPPAEGRMSTTDFEQKMAGAASEEARRQVALEYVEAEAKSADERTVAARNRLRELLAKEGVVQQQVAEHGHRVETLEAELKTRSTRAEAVQRDIATAQALEARRDAVKKQLAALEADVTQLGATLGAKEAVWRGERAATTERVALLEGELARLAAARNIVETALVRARECLTSMAETRPSGLATPGTGPAPPTRSTTADGPRRAP